MNRAIWYFPLLPERHMLPWPCPSCGQAALSVIAGTLHSEESRTSVGSKVLEEWDPEWTEGYFICLFRCACTEIVAVAGRAGLSQEFVGSGELEVDYVPRYEPLFFRPAPSIIALPREVPQDVVEQFRRSFELFWSDLEACANSLRSATERLLDSKGIPRTAPDKHGKIRSLDLNNRIQLFAQQDRSLSEKLMAVRVLGNIGSHSGALVREDLLDAFEILEYVLEEMFLKRSRRIAEIADKITSDKKPRSQT